MHRRTRHALPRPRGRRRRGVPHRRLRRLHLGLDVTLAGRHRGSRQGRHPRRHLPGRAAGPRPGHRLGGPGLGDRAHHVQQLHQVRVQARHGRHRDAARPRHRGAVAGQRRHRRRRQDVHLPPQEGHQVRAAGEPGGHVRRLQVQLRAHDGRPQGAGDRLLRRRRRRPGVHGRQGQGDRGLHDAGRLHGRHQAREAGHGVHGRHGHVVHRRGRPGSGSRSGAGRSTGTRSAPVRSCSTTGPPGQEIVVTRNPDYYAPDTVYLDGIDFEFSLNPSTALLKLQRGDVNVLGDYIPPAEYVRVKADPGDQGPGRRGAGHRHRLPVPEPHREAVRRPQGAPGDQHGRRPHAHHQAPERRRRPAHPAVSGRAAGPPGRRRRRVLRLRPGEGEAAARRRRVPQRLLDHPVLPQRRSRGRA